MDYKLSPDVKDIRRFSIARLEPGQCLFVPSGWIHQINVLDGDHSFEVKKHDETFMQSSEPIQKKNLSSIHHSDL